MQKLIDQVAAWPAIYQRLVEDPLGMARTEGYAVSDEHIRHLLGADDSANQDVREILTVLLSRFGQGKWYQLEGASESGS